MSDKTKDGMSFDNDPGKLDENIDDLDFTFSNIPVLGAEKDKSSFSFDNPDNDPSLASFEALLSEQPKQDDEFAQNENVDNDSDLIETSDDVPDVMDESIDDLTAQSHFDVERVKSMRKAKRRKKKLIMFAYFGAAVFVLVGLTVLIFSLFAPSSKNSDAHPLTPKQLAAAKAARLKKKLDATMVAADKLFDDGDYDAAFTKYQSVLDTDDARSAAHLGLGKCFESKHDMESAIKEYQRAIDLTPKTPAPFNRLAHALLRNDKIKAKEVLSKGIAKFPDDEELLLTFANLCFNTGDAGKALETYKKMDAGNMDLKDIRNFAFLMEVESKEDAKKLLISAAKKFKDLSVYMAAAKLAKDNDDRIAILLDAEKEMADDKTHIDELAYRIAQAYGDDGQKENTLKYLKKIKIENMDKNFYASVFKLARDSGLALQDAIMVENINTPKDTKHPKVLALALYFMKLAPKRIDIQLLVLSELAATMPTDDVLDVYGDLWSSKRNDPLACFLYASALKKASIVDAATKYFEKALSLKPDFYEALLALSDTQMTSSKWSEADATLRKCVQLKPKAFQPREMLAKVEIMLGKGKKALSQFALFLNTTEIPAPQKILRLTELSMNLPGQTMVDKYLARLKSYPDLKVKYRELKAKRQMIFGGVGKFDFVDARKGLFRQYRIIHMLSQGKYREVLSLPTPREEFPDFWKVYVMLNKRIIKRKAYQPPVSEGKGSKKTAVPAVKTKTNDIIEKLYEKTRTSKNIPEKIISAIWNGKRNLKFAEKHLSQIPPDQLALYYLLLAEEYKFSNQRMKARIRLLKAMSAPQSVYRPLVEYLERQR